MPQNELLIDVLRRNVEFLKMTVADMSDADLLQRPVPAANNGLWQIGQLVAAEAHFINMASGKTIIELPAGFAERYKTSTASIDDPAKLGNKADLLALLESARDKSCTWVGTLSSADMAKPAPEKMQKMFPTIGHMIYMLPAHVAMHVGQIQVLRRKLGKPVLF